MTRGATDGDRRRHYGVFYGLDPVPDAARLAVVYGNCQAESLRLTLTAPDLATVRIPPVHELAAEDLPHLTSLLARVSLLISQPVRDGYRDLPLGHRQLRSALSQRAATMLIPVIRFAGLYPASAIIRPPSDRSLVPPLVPYHDLRILLRAAGRDGPPPLTPAAVTAIAELSRAELGRRETAHDTIEVSDLFAAPDFGQMRTINHPGNAIWGSVAHRVRSRLGLDDAPVPVRPLLNEIHAPRESAVIDAFGLHAAPRPHWLVGGLPCDPDEVRAAHLAWYEAHPDAVAEGLRRHADALTILVRR